MQQVRIEMKRVVRQGLHLYYSVNCQLYYRLNTIHSQTCLNCECATFMHIMHFKAMLPVSKIHEILQIYIFSDICLFKH